MQSHILDDVRAALKHIAGDGHRGSTGLDSVRSLFHNDHGARTDVSVNCVIGEVLAVVRGETGRSSRIAANRVK